MSPSAPAAKLDAKLTRMTQEDRFFGAVMIAKNGEALWQKAYGQSYYDYVSEAHARCGADKGVRHYSDLTGKVQPGPDPNRK